MAGILHALETNAQYFIGRRFKVYTDHNYIKYMSLKQSQGRLYRWSLRLQSYQFDIEHLPRARMPADFLSRIVDKVDSTTPDLEDDSHLVLALTSDGVSQQDTAQIVRPSGNPDRKRRTCIITLMNCHDPESRTNKSLQTTDTPSIVLFVATKPDI